MTVIEIARMAALFLCQFIQAIAWRNKKMEVAAKNACNSEVIPSATQFIRLSY